ncbi:uncharacterized protein LOC120363240 isoform X2 [Saimiri boliviensis]|uniref:uncharacterized protein LOC120363240 isoform X2 n=1 Tax=Saimiri boliviensis TaxID=27679 RepID=UPI003D7746C4
MVLVQTWHGRESKVRASFQPAKTHARRGAPGLSRRRVLGALAGRGSQRVKDASPRPSPTPPPPRSSAATCWARCGAPGLAKRQAKRNQALEADPVRVTACGTPAPIPVKKRRLSGQGSPNPQSRAVVCLVPLYLRPTCAAREAEVHGSSWSWLKTSYILLEHQKPATEMPLSCHDKLAKQGSGVHVQIMPDCCIRCIFNL